VLVNQYVTDRFYQSKNIQLSKCAIGGTFFVKRGTLISLNGFNEVPIGEDAVLFERAKRDKIEMMETNLPSYIYHRELQNSITHRIQRRA
jgi:hypothetical protein